MRLAAAFAVVCAASASGSRSTSLCEKLDGDCSPCPLLEPINSVARMNLSVEASLVANARTADEFIRKHSSANGTDIIRFDDPAGGLHTSLFYFCCHGLLQQRKIKTALQDMRWTSFAINYDSFGCNLDHDNKTVYLHALPANQSELFAWAAMVESALQNAGVPVHHPRRSLFHMTLARVTTEYPTDNVVRALESTHFGSHRLCSFTFAGVKIRADDCKHTSAPSSHRSEALYPMGAVETILYLGDPQIGFSGDADLDAHRFGLAADAAASDADAAVIAGDCVNAWSNSTQDALFKSVFPSRFQSTKAYLVPGNHDIDSKLADADKVLQELSHFRTTFNVSDYGAFDTKYARFILMNTEMLIIPFLGLNGTHDARILALADAQWQFIESSLRSAAASKQHLILVGHHPPFINDEAEPHSYYNMPLQPRKRLLTLARTHGVRHLLCGHTHTTRGVATSDGIRVLTTAGTARAFDTNGCGYHTLRINATAIDIVYTELAGGGGQPGCTKTEPEDIL